MSRDNLDYLVGAERLIDPDDVFVTVSLVYQLETEDLLARATALLHQIADGLSIDTVGLELLDRLDERAGRHRSLDWGTRRGGQATE